MHTIQLQWSEFKSDLISASFPYNCYPVGNGYDVFVVDRSAILWICTLRESSEITEFETYYKANANPNVYDNDGKMYIRAEGRPLGTSVCFASAGDSATLGIGEGKDLSWDFSNSEDEIDAPSGYKRKRIVLQYLDTVYLKEGTVYFFNCKKGTFLDVYVAATTGAYYKKNDGSYNVASEDMPVAHYVIKHKMQSDCPMGDELNTETVSEGFPPNYQVWVEITVPSDDYESNGYILLELYRSRTMIL